MLNSKLVHESYVSVLRGGTQKRVTQRHIRSLGNRNFTIQENRIALSAMEDKRLWLSDGIRSYPYGFHPSLISTIPPIEYYNADQI